MAMLHVVDPSEEDEAEKLRKVSSFLEFFKDKCKALYQPFQHIAVDERMVKSKHRSGIRQYKTNKVGHKALGVGRQFEWLHL